MHESSLPETLSLADYARLNGVLNELYERLAGMVDWLQPLGGEPDAEQLSAALKSLRERFVPDDPHTYTLDDFSSLWGITNNPVANILAWSNEDGRDQSLLDAALADYMVELARIPSLILDLLEVALADPQRARRALTSLRRFHDLWIDCAEAAFSEVAHGEAYCRAQGRTFNAMIAAAS